MPSHVFAVPLPLFDETERLNAALDSAGVVASGGLVSTDGDRYWVHNVEELMTLPSKQRDHDTLQDLRARGRPLKPVDLGEQKSGGFRLVKPKSGEAQNALRDFFSDIRMAGPSLEGFGRTALVYSHSGSAYVVVGKTYHCSQHGEFYDQSDYDQNNGDCPRHQGAKLILNKNSF